MGRWARAAAAVTAWKSLKVAIFGYHAMNDMGDIRVDESALVKGASARKSWPSLPATCTAGCWP